MPYKKASDDMVFVEKFETTLADEEIMYSKAIKAAERLGFTDQRAKQACAYTLYRRVIDRLNTPVYPKHDG